ncbi:hypothetical protein CAPTEDRAFT_200072 [Capitella teleta]|uniref:Apple domain-containing protein n=1 Tax=Capitella teleta TaxID=283909 RepID=R7TPS9_CAPTE|nr:hypothetical protein CAPTEDRAFT_200072 [Capitella teleta]|eukprot:ELT95873.1 hypothetical protein CAPTEDRAFT_200072 [Capitella teleta]
MQFMFEFILLCCCFAANGAVGFFPQVNTGARRWHYSPNYDYYDTRNTHQQALLDYYNDHTGLLGPAPGDYGLYDDLYYYDPPTRQQHRFGIQPFEPVAQNLFQGNFLQPNDQRSQHFDHNQGRYMFQKSYSRKPKRKHKMVKLPQKNKKKMKIISIDRGFYIPGGIQVFKKFYDIKGCMKACAQTPNCFAGDFNPWLGKCYVHTNLTACAPMKSHKKITHFKKVPCSIPDAPRGLIILGAQLHFAIEQKGIDSLTDCIKKCAIAGEGIPATDADRFRQVCFGIDYDFGTHKCYFHVRNTNPGSRICARNAVNTPRDLVANPSVVYIALYRVEKGDVTKVHNARM